MTPGPTGTYSGNPTTSPKDEVRFLVGDTGYLGQPWQLADAEIQYQFGIVYGTSPIPASGNFLPAAYCADAIAARYKNLVDKSVGDLRISFNNLAKQFEAIAVRLRSRATIATVPTYFGGLSLTEKLAAYSNTDLLTTAVRIDGMDNSGTSINANSDPLSDSADEP